MARASNVAQDLAYLLNERDQERRRGGTASEVRARSGGVGARGASRVVAASGGPAPALPSWEPWRLRARLW